METLDPKLKEILANLPGGFYNMQKENNDRFNKIEDKLDEAVYVNLTNGDGKRVKVANIIPKMHKDILSIRTDLVEIKEVIEFLSDFKKLHKLLKKYKIYYIITITTLLIMGLGVKDIIVDALKNFIH